MKSFWFFLFLFSISTGYSQTHFERSYYDTLIGGWHVRVNYTLHDHAKLLHRTTVRLSHDLQSIQTKLPKSAIDELKEMRFWLEFNVRNGLPLQYHYSADWLKQNGFEPQKESSVEIEASDYSNFSDTALTIQPLMACAYQHRVLGLNNVEVTQAYEHAKNQSLFSEVFDMHAFPFKDIKEYFQALSTAYFFGRSPYVPFDRVQLKALDPEGYKMIEKVWGTPSRS